MNKLGSKLSLMAAAVMGAASIEYFDTINGRRRVIEKKESREDRERRERCEQIAIEKAKAKRERKAKKMRELNARKEENK